MVNRLTDLITSSGLVTAKALAMVVAEANQVKAAFGFLGQRVEVIDGDQIVTINDLTTVIANMRAESPHDKILLPPFVSCYNPVMKILVARDDSLHQAVSRAAQALKKGSISRPPGSFSAITSDSDLSQRHFPEPTSKP